MTVLRTFASLVFAVGLLAPGVAMAVTVKGAGATFPQPVYARWAALYGAETGVVVTYDGTGSGAGVKAIEDGTVAFGASDAPLDDGELAARGLMQFPTMVGGIVPVVDLPGIGPGDLVLDARTLAELFAGRIAFWDAADVTRLNPHLPLPHLAVTPVHRSDASGTTAVFADYLATAPDRSGARPGRDRPELNRSGAAAAGSEGMARAVAATPGAIGYVGFDYAQANRLTYVDLVNPAGRVVQPSLASIAAAAASADWSHGLAPSLVARDGGASWPIVTCTYVLMRRGRLDETIQAALGFFAWAEQSGGAAAEDLGFVALPPAAVAEIDRLWHAMTDTTLHTIVHKTVVVR